MSYSFKRYGKTKKELKAAVAEEMDKAVKNQPEFHKHDKDAAVAAAGQYINCLGEPKEDECFYVEMYGSVNVDAGACRGVSVKVEAYFKPIAEMPVEEPAQPAKA